MKLRHAVRRKENLPPLKRLAVFVAQHAAACADRGQHPVVRTQQEKRPHRMAVVSRHFAEVHRIERHGDRADAVLREHKTEELSKLLRVERSIAQNFHKLVHHAAEDAPQLRRFLGALGLAGGKELLRARLKRFAQTDLVKIAVQRADLVLRRAAAAHALMQMCKGRLYTCAQIVHCLEPRARFVRPLRAIAVRVRRPRRLARPHRAADLPLERVVFQDVALVHRQPRKPRLETAEHVLVFKPARRRIECAEQQR